MDFIWAGTRNLYNTKLVFTINLVETCDTITVCAVDFYRVFVDDKMVAFGPARTAAGFSRKKEIPLNNAKFIKIEVLGYNIPCYACDFQLPFFGAEITRNGNVVYGTCDFSCFSDTSYVRKAPRYSSQRGFVEIYDLKKQTLKPVKPYIVKSPVIIDGLKDNCRYNEEIIPLNNKSESFGFNTIFDLSWEKKKHFKLPYGTFNIYKKFIRKLKNGANIFDFSLLSEHTGFIKITISAKENCRIFAVMDELALCDGVFKRLECNNVIAVFAPKGESSVLSFEPYAFKFLRVFCFGDAEISASIVYFENNATVEITSDNQCLNEIFKSARATFNQNVIDIPMDCPSRERAGWLCDSYFMGLAENLFTGNNFVERAFLENILIADISEIEDGMIPKCFPAQHRNTVKDENRNNLYIPNWAMFFYIELESYFFRTGDDKIVGMAKDKAYKLLDFFSRYENEFGLLEDLDGWIFVEWSVCNTKDYTKGVNFPTNILYSAMLNSIASLYGDGKLSEKAEKLKKTIKDLSFSDGFFVENAVRVNGKLVQCTDHISETCQYYALFFGIQTDENYNRKMEEFFGPKSDTDTYRNIGRSNMFIGFYLRLLWLSKRHNSSKRILEEVSDALYTMAKTTGTLWEHNDSHASCNHGFASSIAVIILKSFFGFKQIKDGKPVFEKDFKSEKPDVNIYLNGELL